MLPRLPRVSAPEVVGPEKPTFEEIRTQSLDLLVIEVRRADLGHHHERTLEQRFIREPDDQVVRLAVGVKADWCPRELRQTDRKIHVGLWVVDPPTTAISAAATIRHAAKMELAVRVGRFGHSYRRQKASATLGLAIGDGRQ